ncbi:YdcF family protein [Methylocystis sp. H62]|uniref:YdcF family protein n=1 Tax=Methylocystis sp. H62 TaxID=2785789 RepID=UPI0018C22404|nr:YdcF family protein [Methylocystis sp. H62]MBG0791939.1 YdcF family protein [Methylocystis sp. H62]
MPELWMERWLQRRHGANGPLKLLLRATPRILAGGIIAVVAVSFMAFDAFSLPSRKTVRSASAAVIFTGQFERVDAGLRLLEAKDVPRLYISGVNAGAGILLANFVNQFSTRNPEIVDLRQLVQCCVELGEHANNTLQNARDAQCWVERRGVTGPLLLITSEQHMARAMAALSGTLPSFRIIPYPVHDSSQPLVGSARLRGYFAVVATFVAVRLPLLGMARQIYGPFAEGCRSSDQNVAGTGTR